MILNKQKGKKNSARDLLMNYFHDILSRN